jgi:tetratricopeptide (TPR) repeat protein
LLLSELAAADDDSVPLPLRDLVVRRMDDAGAAAPTLRAAAVLGRDIDLDLLARVVERSPSEVLDHLERGIRLALLIEDRDGMRFRHEILREAIETDTTLARQSWIHSRAAELLAERPDANPVELATHARLGGNPHLVARGLVEAAELARRRFDLTGAEALLGEALTVEENGELLIRRSRVRMARGDFAGADQDAVAALGAGSSADALELRAWAARNRHDMDAAIRLGRAGADLASDSAQRASCLLAVAFAHRGTGDLRAADRVLEEALDVPIVPAGVAAWTGVLRTHQGRPQEALATLEPLLGADAGGLHSFWVEHMLQMTAHALGMVGRAADALSVLDRLDRELERRGSDSRYAGMPDAYRSWVLRNLGVRGAVDLARSTAEGARMVEVRAQSRLDLVDSLLMEGQVDAAVEAFEATAPVLADPALSNRWRCEQRSGILSARLHLAAGDAHEALDRAGEVVDVATARGDLRYATIGRLVQARALARLGRAVDEQQVNAELDRLSGAAAIEAWWLAADVAADTGLEHGLAVARAAAVRLREHAGVHRTDFERAARAFM